MDRIADLESLTAREFAAKHGVESSVIFDRRLMLVGQSAREIGWWRNPDVRQVLPFDLSLSQAGRKLGISISHAKRLRDRARQESRPADQNSTPSQP